MVSREVFGSFVKLRVGKPLWFELMRGGEGMPQLEVHDKQGAGAEVNDGLALHGRSPDLHGAANVSQQRAHS